MEESLDELFADVATWPEDDRAELIEIAREIESGRTGIYVPTAEERAAIEEGLADIERGDFIEGAELEAFWEEMKR